MSQRLYFASFFLLVSFSLESVLAKGRLNRAKVLFTDYGTHVESKKWSRVSRNPEQNKRLLLKIIAKSQTGRALIQRAKDKAAEYGQTLIDILKEGEKSLTDTTLIRRFSEKHPQHIVYESRSQVFIDRNLSVLEAVLDTVHELTHYTYRLAFNPYRKSFSLSSFIKNTIEGSGGEVDAYLMECKVLYELYPAKTRNRFRCQRVMTQKGEFSKVYATAEFYKVGNRFSQVVGHLKRKGILKHFPYLTDETAEFISSAYGEPYPLAALKEFESVHQRACLNDEGRLLFLKNDLGRVPSNTDLLGQRQKIYRALLASYNERCRS